MGWGNNMNKRRILLVDDDADLRKTLVDQLAHYREFDLLEGGTAADAAKAVLAVCEEAYRALIDPRARRTARMKLIDDPSRIEASAEMLGEKAELLAMRDDKPGAIAAIQMALELIPGDPKLQSIGSKLLR